MLVRSKLIGRWEVYLVGKDLPLVIVLFSALAFAHGLVGWLPPPIRVINFCSTY